MVDRRGGQSLGLSSLRSEKEYPLVGRGVDERCLIHVKLTESSAKDIDNLIASNKGAVFTLWFSENGGHMTIPAANGDRKFQFSTAGYRRGGHSNLECLHQSFTHAPEQQQLLTLGAMEHKLTVKATEEVYETTKKRVTQVEAERRGTIAKEIKLTKGFKSKPTFSTVTASPKPSSGILGGAGRGKATPHSSSMFNKSAFNKATVAAAKSSSPSGGSGRNQKTLRERIVHLLALRPLKREDIVMKLKKATKRSESAMTNISSILTEVAELQDSVYHLRSQFLSELQVDTWPYYNDQERQLMRRKLNNISKPQTTTTQDLPVAASNSSLAKRALTDFSKPSDLPASKKTKMAPTTDPAMTTSHLLPAHTVPFTKKTSPPFPPRSAINSTSSITSSSSSSSPPFLNTTGSLHTSQSDYKPFPSSATFTSSSIVPTNSSLDSSTTTLPSSNHPHPPSQRSSDHTHSYPSWDASSEGGVRVGVGNGAHQPAPVTVSASMGSKKRDREDGSQHKDRKRKKKHKHLKDQATCETPPTLSATKDISSVSVVDKPARSDASSTSGTPDWSCEYPRITSDQQRAAYKRLFNDEYSEYLQVKRATDEVQDEVMALTKQLNSLRKDTDEFKQVKRKIRDKYLQIQEDKEYQTKKKRFLLLHYKLAHVKKMVVEYDLLHEHSNDSLS